MAGKVAIEVDGEPLLGIKRTGNVGPLQQRHRFLAQAALPASFHRRMEPDAAQVVDPEEVASLGILVWSGYICSTAVFQLYRRTLGNLLVICVQFGVTYTLYLLLVPSLNIYGAVLGDILGVIAGLVLSFWLLKRWFKLDLLRQNRSLGGQVLLLAGFILPAWLFPSTHPPLNVAWLVISFMVFITYLMMTQVPAPSDLRILQAHFEKSGALNKQIFYGIGRVIAAQVLTFKIKQALRNLLIRDL